MRVGLLGLGNWGTALAQHLAQLGNEVIGWTIQAEIVEGINQSHRNPCFQSQITLDPRITATTDIIAAQKEVDVVVIVLPASALVEVVPQIDPNQLIPYVSAVKGLVEQNLLTPLQFIAQIHPQLKRLVTLSGPSFAHDVVRGLPAGIVAASKEEVDAITVAELFSGGTLRVYTSTDPLGVELGGIVKNVIALAAGAADGMVLGDSARAALITRGLAEMARLAEAMGAERQTLSGLSGLGDLVMTASCDTSRNRTVGYRLGKGESLEDILDSLGSVAEGVRTAPLVAELAKQHRVEMPITEGVVAVLHGKMSPDEMLQKLLNRPLKAEF